MPTRRYQIHLDPKQHDMLRRLAFERRTPVSVLVRTAIEAWLKREGKRPARKGRAR